jgi:hypothetical protein
LQKFEKIEEKVIKNELVSMTCDICGKDLRADFIEDQECFNIVHYGGYGSIWGDGSIIAIDICQQCFNDKFSDRIRYISEDGLTV